MQRLTGRVACRVLPWATAQNLVAELLDHALINVDRLGPLPGLAEARGIAKLAIGRLTEIGIEGRRIPPVRGLCRGLGPETGNENDEDPLLQ